MDYKPITVFVKKERNIIQIINFILNSSNNIDNKYRKVKIDFST